MDTEEEFEDWVEKHKEPVMQKLQLDNYFHVWRDPEEEERMILAFCDEETREGRAMYKLLRKLADENQEHAGTLEIVLIDPGELNGAGHKMGQKRGGFLMTLAIRWKQQQLAAERL